ncbi:hypothetical protein CH373_03790 [Leptospira perolatii]|uniref:Lipoprotein n=1 Tax=Leptospira perolatii TaxID=2023191 RepID=A0A2M9ZT18_9LEPT|nr:hypothetical protein CH360_14670 [Leptospira perolatii]PJZ75242.1 hypothetical protein CH373_03790 [Leptospira perolatii]
MAFCGVATLASCQHTTPNKVDMKVTGGGNVYQVYLDVDNDKTPNCGNAAPYTGGTGTSTTGGTTTTTPTTGGSTTNSRYLVTSTLYMKTGEILILRFIYDNNQNQGTVDPQQGFSFSGSVGTSSQYIPAVTGKFGKVFWGGSGVPVYDSSSGGAQAQALQYLDVDINLTGNFSTTTGGVQLNQCFTVDGVKCTAQTSSTTCFTQDNISCFSTSASTGAAAAIQGSVSCNAPGVFPAGT